MFDDDGSYALLASLAALSVWLRGAVLPVVHHRLSTLQETGDDGRRVARSRAWVATRRSIGRALEVL